MVSAMGANMKLRRPLFETSVVVTDWQLTEQARSAVMEQTISQEIMRRTGGRIQMLKVEVTENDVVIRGFVSSYYLKQLALQGALDAIGSCAESRLQLNVRVLNAMSCGDAK
jgi:hypothetical protein